MIAPIGSFLTGLDTALTGGLDALLTSFTAAMATPIVLAAVAFYAVQGLKLANGDPAPLHNFVPQLIRVGVIIWLSSNLTAFDQWVRDTIYIGLPAALNQAVAGAGAGGNGAVATGVSATAAIFDQVWSQMWEVVGAAWAHAGMLDFGIMLAGAATALTGGLGLLFMALVYIAGRFLLAIVIALAPVAIGCAMFDATKGVLERAIGKVISLILLQVAAVIVLQIVLAADQAFMGNLIAAANLPIAPGAVTPSAVAGYYATGAGDASQASEVQSLVSMVVMFVAGAYAMYSLPTIAYSLGTGIAVSAAPLVFVAVAAGKLGSFVAGKVPAFQGGGGGGGTPNYDVTLPPRAPLQMQGGSSAAPLPPPPPPSIASSTRT